MLHSVARPYTTRARFSLALLLCIVYRLFMEDITGDYGLSVFVVVEALDCRPV